MIIPVSVVMPAYNRQDLMPEAIESILGQTFREFELIIVDDCSTDNTLQVAIGYQKRDTRIRIHHHKKNMGIAGARNTGLRLAQGKYIAWMDSDDISMPERIEKQFLFMESHPEIGVLGTAAIVIDTSGKYLGVMDYPLSHPLLLWALCFYDPIINPSAMVRSNLLLASGGYSTAFSQAEDYEMYARLSRSTQLANLPERLLRLRMHATNTSIMYRSKQLECSTIISSKMICDLTGNEVPISPLELAWTRRHISTDELVQVSSEIQALYEYFLGLPLTPQEKYLLRRDYALRIARLVQNCTHASDTPKLLLQALKFDPFAIADILRLGFKKIINRKF
jgi:hypothetical protein